MEKLSIRRSQKIGIIRTTEGSGTKEARNVSGMGELIANYFLSDKFIHHFKSKENLGWSKFLKNRESPSELMSVCP